MIGDGDLGVRFVREKRVTVVSLLDEAKQESKTVPVEQIWAPPAADASAKAQRANEEHSRPIPDRGHRRDP